MRLNELIELLEFLKERHGNTTVNVDAFDTYMEGDDGLYTIKGCYYDEDTKTIILTT